MRLRNTLETFHALLCTVLFASGLVQAQKTVPHEGARAGDLNRLAAAAAGRVNTRTTHLEKEKALAILCGLGSAARSAIEDLAVSTESCRRLAAVRVLAERGDLDDLVPFLRDESHTVRVAALDGIRARHGLCAESLFSHDANRVEAIAPLLDDPFWPVRRAAVLALCASRNPAAAPSVLRAFHDPEPEVRRAALVYVDDLFADLAIADLEKATSHLSEAELIQFLKIAAVLARPRNAGFFHGLALSTERAPVALLALVAAVASRSSLSCAEAAGPRLDWILEQSVQQSGVGEDAADTLVGWLAGKHETELVTALESALHENRLPAAAVVELLWDSLNRAAIPILERWAIDHIEEDAIVDHCLTHIDTENTVEGAAALARLLPLLEGALRERAVKKAVNYMEIFGLYETEHPGVESLRQALVHVALHDPPRTALGAFGAICRMKSLSPPLLADLFERFRAESQKGVRESFVRPLSDAGRGSNRPAVARLFIDEVAEARPAALIAAALLDNVMGDRSDYGDAAAFEKDRAAAVRAIISLCEGTGDTVQREVLLLALIGLNDRQTDAYVARRVEELWTSEGYGGVGRLVSALGEFDGALSTELLRRMARDELIDLSKRGVSALLSRRDPSAIAILDEVFDRLTSSSRNDLVEKVAKCGLTPPALRFLEKIVDHEQDSGIRAIAIDSLDEATIRSRRQKLLEIAADRSGAAGRAASCAAIAALGRVGDDEGLRLFRDWALAFSEEARVAPPPFFDLFYDRPNRVLCALRALGENSDDAAPAILAGLLLQHQRALSDRTILENWEANAGGSEERPDHAWALNVLQLLLLYEDPIVVKALLAELEKLERSGDLFLLGDGLFGKFYFELQRRGRCPALRERFGALVFSCRPSHSPAEFRLSLDLGERAAAADRPAEAAEHYLRAYYILRYHAPAKEVVRQLLADSNSFVGYAPAPSLISEALALMADAMARGGDDLAAARLARGARERSPFVRQFGRASRRGTSRVEKEQNHDE